MALYGSPDYQFRFNWPFCSRVKFIVDFQDGDHGGLLGHPIRTILDTFDLQITSILQMKFPVNQLFGSEEKFQNKFPTWLLGWQSWISDQNEFRYFLIYKSTLYFLSSFKSVGLSVQEKKHQNRSSRWPQRWPSSTSNLELFYFKMAIVVVTLDFRSERFLLFLICESLRYFLPSFESAGLSVKKNNGGHLGFQIWKI